MDLAPDADEWRRHGGSGDAWNVHGPGHPALWADSDAWVMAYHYYTSSGSRLGVNLVGWNGDWPTLY